MFEIGYDSTYTSGGEKKSHYGFRGSLLRSDFIEFSLRKISCRLCEKEKPRKENSGKFPNFLGYNFQFKREIYF